MVKHVKADVTDAAILSETPHAATENLADLVQEAVTLEATPSPAEAKQQEQQAEQQAQASEGAVEVIFAGLTLARRLARPKFEWWRDFGQVWSDETLMDQAKALDEFGTAMGWNASELLDKLGPYIKLAVAFGVPCFMTWEAVQLQRQLAGQQQRQAQPAASDGSQQ